MPRKKRTRLKFDQDSLNNLLQEIYDDSHNIRAKITKLFNKWDKKALEDGHIAAFGDSIVKLINAEAKNQDQKIMLLKYLKEVVYAEDTAKTTETPEISDDKKNVIMEMVQNEIIAKEKAKANKY